MVAVLAAPPLACITLTASSTLDISKAEVRLMKSEATMVRRVYLPNAAMALMTFCALCGSTLPSLDHWICASLMRDNSSIPVLANWEVKSLSSLPLPSDHMNAALCCMLTE